MKSKRQWWVRAIACHHRTDGPFSSAFKAAQMAESLLPEDGWKRVWISSKPLRPAATRERLKKPTSGVETLERLLRWPRLARALKADTLPYLIYSARRKAFLHEDGKQWAPEAKRPGPPNFPARPKMAGQWEPWDALLLARKLDLLDLIELHPIF